MNKCGASQSETKQYPVVPVFQPTLFSLPYWFFLDVVGPKKICGFPVSRPYLAFGRRNRDPKLFYWIMRKIVENGVRLLRTLKKKFKKKKLKPTYPT